MGLGLAEKAHFFVKAKRLKAKGALEKPGIEMRSPVEIFQKEGEVDSS